MTKIGVHYFTEVIAQLKLGFRFLDHPVYVAICARQVKVTWLCHGQEQLALVHEAFQSLVC